jgi:hypothetical protein
MVETEQDKIIGLKVRIDAQQTSTSNLQTDVSDGELILYTVNGHEYVYCRKKFVYQRGDYLLSGYFVVKFAGFHTGRSDYEFSAVDEEKVILSRFKTRIVSIR